MLATAFIGGINTRIVVTDARHGLAANQTTYTITGLSFGDEHPRRRIFVGVAVLTATGVEPNSVTIGGVTATKHIGQAPPGSTSSTTQIWSALVPTGTTGTVVISVGSGDMDAGSVYVWAAYDLASAAARDTAAATLSASGVDLSVDVPAGGFVIAVAAINNVNAATFAFSGLTNNSSDGTPNFQSAGAAASKVAGGTPMAITATYTISAGTFGPNAVAASFR